MFQRENRRLPINLAIGSDFGASRTPRLGHSAHRDHSHKRTPSDLIRSTSLERSPSSGHKFDVLMIADDSNDDLEIGLSRAAVECVQLAANRVHVEEVWPLQLLS